MTDSTDPAFPMYNGLTKREHFAALALQGLCATYCTQICEDIALMPAGVAECAVRMADALIAALNAKGDSR